MYTRYIGEIKINMTTTAPTNGTEEPWTPFINPVNQVKIGMAAGLLVSVFIVTLIPYFVVKRMSKKWDIEDRESSISYKRFTTWMSRINCFAGGVFLSTGFMDIFPEMLETVELAKIKNKIENHFPLGPFLTLVGFFMILIIEEVVTFVKNSVHSGKVNPETENVNDEAGDRPLLNASPSEIGDSDSYNFNPEGSNTKKARKHFNQERKFHDHSMDHTHHEHHEHGLDADALSRGNLSVTVLMIAISIHSIFEGLALGLEKDTSSATRLFLALCLHKYIIAITIGLQISKSSLGIKMACVCSGIFSFATPFGVLLGFWVVYLQEIGNTSFSMVAGVLQGLACGTFFYIVFFEILPEEFSKRYDKLVKIIALLSGFGLVSLFIFFIHE